MSTVDPLVGRVFADAYRLEERLGAGGFGAVYRAVHIETGGQVAVKLLRPEKADEGIIRRFELEARNTHRLAHPNTVRLSHFGRTPDGLLYMVMEHVDGVSLGAVLRKEGRLSPLRTVRITEQVLKSLGEAHALRMVHRDIKPDNVMLVDQFGEPDFVKVLDFGVSRDLDGTGADTSGPLGTVAYIAPEVWLNEDIDGRADLYALGCMMYHMLAGAPPFVVPGRGRKKLPAYMYAHLKKRPRPLGEVVGEGCPAALSAVIDALLAKDPAARPADAGAVLERLAAVRANHDLADTLSQVLAAPITVTTGGDVEPLPVATVAPEGRGGGVERQQVLIVVALIVLGFSGGVWWWGATSTGARVQPPPVVAPRAAEPTLSPAPAGQPAAKPEAEAEAEVVELGPALEVALASEPPGAAVLVGGGGTPVAVTPARWVPIGPTLAKLEAGEAVALTFVLGDGRREVRTLRRADFDAEGQHELTVALPAPEPPAGAEPAAPAEPPKRKRVKKAAAPEPKPAPTPTPKPSAESKPPPKDDWGY